MNNFIPLSLEEHRNLKFNKHTDLKHSSELHIAPLSVQEFPIACHEYPIVFVKDSETGQFRAVTLLGIKPKQNLFYKQDGWNADYIPEYLRQYPFLLSINPDNPEQGMLCFDKDCDAFTEDDGEALFNEDGTQSDFTKSIGEFIANYNAKQQATAHFAKELADRSLLTSKNLELNLPDDEKYNLTGIYIIDEAKLQEMADEGVLALSKMGLFVPIYAHLLSLSRINNLMKLSAS